MAIKLALQIAKEIRRGEWVPIGYDDNRMCHALKKDGIELWVATDWSLLRVYKPTTVMIPRLDQLIIWYVGGVNKVKAKFEAKPDNVNYEPMRDE